VTSDATVLLLRMPRTAAREQFLALAELVAEVRLPVLAADRADLALATGAAGVNLPEAGLPVGAARTLMGRDRFVGRSVHSLEGALVAAAEGADFVLFGPIFPTPTHRHWSGRGLASLGALARSCPIPVLAIGGIDRERVVQCLAAGAAGFAAIRYFQEQA